MSWSPLPGVYLPRPTQYNNEENNIAACLRSLLSQDYPDFEVIVIDDQSSDATPIILAQIAEAEPRLRLPALSDAVGQMMLFRRQAYQAIGGHNQIRASITDDLTLARRIKAAGLRWRVAYIADLIHCRMYRGSRAAFDGFTKNLFAAFDFRFLGFAFGFSWLAVLFWQPLVVLAFSLIGRAPQAQMDELAVCIGLSTLLWLIPYWAQGVPLGLAFIYPLTLLANEIVALQSLRLSLSGRLTWKDRALVRPNWKWL